jgi:hypothetical protein
LGLGFSRVFARCVAHTRILEVRGLPGGGYIPHRNLA